jgi:hypothetical protein
MAGSPAHKIEQQAPTHLPAYLVNLGIFAAIYIAASQGLVGPAKDGVRAAEKPFETFEQFYPFYLSQHADRTCRRLHVIGTSIIVLIILLSRNGFKYGASLVPAMLGGAAFCNLTSHRSDGLIEAAFMIQAYMMTVRSLTDSWKAVAPAVGLLVVGYGFAWVGHFYFELNRPATFIYPTFSLMGDFKLWYEVVTGSIEF